MRRSGAVIERDGRLCAAAEHAPVDTATLNQPWPRDLAPHALQGGNSLMSWTIERRGRVAVVTMNTNPVNAQNRAFFADLHDAFDRLEARPPRLPGRADRAPAAGSPPASTSTSTSRSSPATARAVADWFADYRATNMRLFTYPRPTVAAVNGHAFAGGLITSAVCDHRIAVDTGARFGLNEVPIGIPMPAVYVRMLAYAWGEPTAARTSLFGETSPRTRRTHLGMFDELVPADELLDRAVAIAESDPRRLPRALRLHQTRRPSRGPARHHRPRRPARQRATRLDDQRQRPARTPPLLATTQRHRTHLVTPR